MFYLIWFNMIWYDVLLNHDRPMFWFILPSGSVWSLRRANVPASLKERDWNLSLLQAPLNFHAECTFGSLICYGSMIVCQAAGWWASKSRSASHRWNDWSILCIQKSLEEMPVAMETECMPEELPGVVLPLWSHECMVLAKFRRYSQSRTGN